MQPVSSDDATSRRVRFTLQPEDMVAAQRLHYTARLRSRASLVSYAVSLLIVAVFAHVVMSDARWYWFVFVFGAAILGGILVPLAMSRWYVPRVARRIYRQQRGLHREIAAEWDETEFRAATERGSSRIAWTDYFRWREYRAIILLCHAENLFQMLPKRLLTEARISDLRATAARASLKGAASRH